MSSAMEAIIVIPDSGEKLQWTLVPVAEGLWGTGCSRLSTSSLLVTKGKMATLGGELHQKVENLMADTTLTK